MPLPAAQDLEETASQLTGAQYLVKALQAYGVTTLFGYPGGAIMPVYDALYQNELKHVLCRHEQGCGFAALGFAKSSNQVGVCLATSGPGATNLITPLADAMLDSVPMVAITGQVHGHLIGTDAFQEVDVVGLSLAVTKHSFLVRDVVQLPRVLKQAFELAQSGRPGPVLVDITKDVQQALIVDQQITPLELVHEKTALPPMHLFQQANALIAASHKPLLYIGGGVASAQACDELNALLDSLQLPVVTTLKGIGCVDPEYPLYLGMLGMHGWPAANKAVQQCDCLIVVGARFDDRVTGKLDEFAPDAKVIHLDIDAAELDKLRVADVALAGDVKQCLGLLGIPGKFSQWQRYCTELKSQDSSQLLQGVTQPFASEQALINPVAFLRQLQQAFPANTAVTCDVGQHQMWVAQHMQFSHPNNHLSSGGLGTMGFGLPAAIGAQMARPNDCVLAVCGDGSFMMNIQELATVNRLQLPLKIVVLDNQKLGMVRQWQELFFEERYSETDLSDNPDFVGLAAACGIKGLSIVESKRVVLAIEQMLSHQGPFLLHVCIPAMENVWPLVPPGKNNQQMLMPLQVGQTLNKELEKSTRGKHRCNIKLV